ncbi:MAG: hypothetical protein LM589_06040 [Thermosphaera sp.]|nr:hypothetical protein [Thermosphaera sp.]
MKTQVKILIIQILTSITGFTIAFIVVDSLIPLIILHKPPPPILQSIIKGASIGILVGLLSFVLALLTHWRSRRVET